MSKPDSSDLPQAHTVRSFVRRAGRLTTAQRLALENHWSEFGLEIEGALDLDAVFGRAAARHLEIGFGMGDALLSVAQAAPDQDFLGIDVYEPGIGRALRGIADLGLSNVRLVRGDAVDLCTLSLADASLDSVLIFFPDPWPKKRHHKRRLISTKFVTLLAAKLKSGARLQLATDWRDYAFWMLEVIENSGLFENIAGSGQFSERPGSRPLTKFERRGQRLGHDVFDLVYRRNIAAAASPGQIFEP